MDRKAIRYGVQHLYRLLLKQNNFKQTHWVKSVRFCISRRKTQWLKQNSRKPSRLCWRWLWETVTAVELTPEGTGYRAKTRFAKFYNLPELMAMFKEVADIKTADMLTQRAKYSETPESCLKAKAMKFVFSIWFQWRKAIAITRLSICRMTTMCKSSWRTFLRVPLRKAVRHKTLFGTPRLQRCLWSRMEDKR